MADYIVPEGMGAGFVLQRVRFVVRAVWFWTRWHSWEKQAASVFRMLYWAAGICVFHVRSTQNFWSFFLLLFLPTRVLSLGKFDENRQLNKRKGLKKCFCWGQGWRECKRYCTPEGLSGEVTTKSSSKERISAGTRSVLLEEPRLGTCVMQELQLCPRGDCRKPRGRKRARRALGAGSRQPQPGAFRASRGAAPARASPACWSSSALFWHQPCRPLWQPAKSRACIPDGC